MIDTIWLSLPLGTYKITTPEAFLPVFTPVDFTNPLSLNELIVSYKGHREFRQNKQPVYRQQGEVFPTLDIYERYKRHIYSCALKVRFSAPKLLRGESVSEISEADYNNILALLLRRLAGMGVSTTLKAIESASVEKVDFCKNILFPSINEARVFLDNLHKCSLGERYENTNTRFANNGYDVRFHSSVFEVVTYLKYFDLLQPSSRAANKRRTFHEKAIANQLKETGIIPPLVRFEVRLNGKPSIQRHIRQAMDKEQTIWTVKELFQATVAQSVLQYNWNQILKDKTNYLLLTQVADKEVCRNLLALDFKPQYLLENLGMYFAIKTLGVKEVKKTLQTKYAHDTWFEKRKTFFSFTLPHIKPNTLLIDLVSHALRLSKACL